MREIRRGLNGDLKEKMGRGRRRIIEERLFNVLRQNLGWMIKFFSYVHIF